MDQQKCFLNMGVTQTLFTFLLKDILYLMVSSKTFSDFGFIFFQFHCFVKRLCSPTFIRYIIWFISFNVLFLIFETGSISPYKKTLLWGLSGTGKCHFGWMGWLYKMQTILFLFLVDHKLTFDWKSLFSVVSALVNQIASECKTKWLQDKLIERER